MPCGANQLGLDSCAASHNPEGVPQRQIGLSSGVPSGILGAVQHDKRSRKPDLTDAELQKLLVNAMAEVGADPALIYAFQKTGVYVCEENEKRLPAASLKAFDGAVDEYLAAQKRPVQ